MAASLDGNVRFRRWLANKLASWARRIYPQSEEAMAFHMDVIMDAIIYGRSVVRMNPMDIQETAKDFDEAERPIVVPWNPR